MFIGLPIPSEKYREFSDVIKRSHKSDHDYANLKCLIESSTLNSVEKSLLLDQLKQKFSVLPC